MKCENKILAKLLNKIDFGSSVAEQDNLLEIARVETSVFSDLLFDKIDLIPGNKGSGKSALYRIFVEFLDELLLEDHKVVIAHGVSRPGDNVFMAFNDQFQKLSEDDFVNFWCIYFISLVHEQFIKSENYKKYLRKCSKEISVFKISCQKAYIPEIRAKKSLTEILEWTLAALARISPSIKYHLPDNSGEIEVDLFGKIKGKNYNGEKLSTILPQYVQNIKTNVDDILTKANLNLWLMVDRLDEIFPRRSELEQKALRGLLRTIRIFSSDKIRIKVFLRDDILDQVVSGKDGFTTLTHITARQADVLRWSEDQILTMIVNRLFANDTVCNHFEIDKERLKASIEYKRKSFYKVFPPTVHKGINQSNTLRWIYTHTADGNNVVTPRDVIILLTRAKQYQLNKIKSDSSGISEWPIGSQALLYGFEELSKYKKTTFLEAEFPHLWVYMSKFIGGKTEYTNKAISKLFGKNWQKIIKDLKSIGFISERKSKNQIVYKIPFIYRKGLDLTQGRL